MRDIGVDIRREPKVIPAKVIVAEHAAHTYACANCQKNGETTPIIKSEPPTALIPGSLASPSFVAYIAAQKYMNGMPLYRLEKGFVYDGVTVARQTMANWIIKCSENYLSAIFGQMLKRLLAAPALHAVKRKCRCSRNQAGRRAASHTNGYIVRVAALSIRWSSSITRKRADANTRRNS